MSTLQRCLVLPAAVVAMIFGSSTASAQKCDSCVSSQTHVRTSLQGWPGQGCSNGCPHGIGAYPGSGAIGGLFHHIKDGVDQYKADCALNHARGSAWPLPFSCWDRESVYAIFNQQFAHGLQTAHALTSEYFDEETNELNRAGEMKVAWIMQVAPQANKQIFLYQDDTAPTLEQRMNSIRQFTQRYYQHLGEANIAMTQIKPNRIPSSYQEKYLTDYVEGQPAPIIPVEVGSTVTSSVGN